MIGRVAILAVALGQAWTCRFVSGADGVAYVDIAKAYLRGDWPNALNSYWSPLYSWLLAAVFSVIKPDAHNTLPLVHAVNFVGFVLAFCGWELLFHEYRLWQGPPAHPRLVRFSASATLLWAAIHLNGMGMNSADIYVIAVLFLLGALSIRVKRGKGTSATYVLIGFVLGLGFLAKAACLILLPAALLFLGRRAWITGLVALLTIAPFITTLSLSKHRFVLSDTGSLNYSMVVGGFSIEGYKESVTPVPGSLSHPFAARANDPRVLSFESHLTGTYPVHNDPAWWLTGLPLRMNTALQRRALWAGSLFALMLFWGCPALPLLLGGGLRPPPLKFILIPSVALFCGYLAIVVHSRYIAGPLAIAGFAAIASVWHTRFSVTRQRGTVIVTMAWIAWVMWADLLLIPLRLGNPPDMVNVTIADSLRTRGLAPASRVAYIGNGLGACWLELDGAQVVAIVPSRIFHNESTIGRVFDITFDQPDRFWHSPAPTQQRTLEAMRDAGAEWVFADNLPKDAIPGPEWTLAGSQPPWGARSPAVYYRKLEPLTRSSR